jgi:hypothetical protein
MRAGTDRDRGGADEHVRYVEHRQHRQAELPEHRVGDRVEVVHRRPMHHHRPDHDDAGKPEQRQHPCGGRPERVGQPTRQSRRGQRATAGPRPDTDRCADRMNGQHAAERTQRMRGLQFGDHRSRVMDDGERDGGGQQRTAQRRRDNPADHEPRCGARSRRPGGAGSRRGRGRCPRRAPHHRQHRQQRHHAQLAAADRDRHLVHAEPHARDRARGAGHVAVGDEQLQEHHRGDDDQRDARRPERDPKQLTRLACADWPVFH